MPDTNQPMLTEDEIEKNPGVDPRVVKEALRMRRELEQMGLWEDRGSQVRNPYDTKPALKPREESRSGLITQHR